jgi:hypothetical protein
MSKTNKDVAVLNDSNTGTGDAPTSTATMRGFLIRQMLDVVEGRQDHQTARSVCSVCRYAQQVYNLLNLELRAANMLMKRGNTMEIKSLEFDG